MKENNIKKIQWKRFIVHSLKPINKGSDMRAGQKL